ncbi:MAG TPA: peptidylprolyl isomerase [Ignavibacteria bacterium]|nr:peptidylprolyl isomerase [Ignavibacteria bacterium]
MLRRDNPFLSTVKNLVLLIILTSFSTSSQTLNEDEKMIFELKDTRSLGKDNHLIEMLRSSDKYKSSMAAFVLSNFSDTTILEIIGEKMLDQESDEFSSRILAFALGQIVSFKSPVYLKQKLNDVLVDNNKALLTTEIINSLGKTGNEEDLNMLTKINSENRLINAAIAMAIARFGMRKIKSDAGFRKLAELFEQTADSTVRRNVTYAFNRINDKDALIAYNTELIISATSPDPLARMWAVSAIGKQQDTASIEFLLDVLSKEIDWRVRVNIVNALGNYKIDLNSPLLEKTVNALIEHAENDPSVHVSIVSWQALGKLFAGADTRNPFTRKIQQEILFITTPGKAYDWQIKAEAIKTYARIFKDEAKADLFAIFNSTDNYDIKSAVVESFGFFDDPLVYKDLRENVSNDVMKYNEIHPNKDGSMIGSNDLAKMYRAFVNALTELDDKMDSENRNIIRLIFSEFASSKDAPLTEICLSNLQDSIYMQYRAETCQIMTFDYQSFTLPKDKDVMLMYIEAWGNMKFDGAKDILTNNLKSSDYDIAKTSSDALQKITGEDRSGKITAPKYRTDFDWDFIAKLEQKKFAAIKTNQGIIVAELNYKISPFTVQNFVKLGENGYYNNTIFHRVVPNFVIQGGDPTGTGFGGPGYSIRSELSPFPFDEYTIGMASSGKDTEGSQFFITHSPQPHLDGKYTMFGKVVEGFDVVDKIQIGDVIETITFSASR